MTTVAHGPYEHVGAYADLAESEAFDTSGTPNSFCPSCEHDPCVAEYTKYPLPGGRCSTTPRYLSVHRVTEAIHIMGRQLPEQAKKVYQVMVIAVHALGAEAVYGATKPEQDNALRYLVQIRDEMRRLVAS